MTGPKWVFSHDDLSVYERIDPREFPSYDEIDSRDIRDRGAPGGEGPVSIHRAGPFPRRT